MAHLTTPKPILLACPVGLHAIVDADDHEWLSRYTWHVTPSPGAGTFYARRRRGSGAILMHREIMRPPRQMVVDHVNGNGLDNRRCHLRTCTPAQNGRNSGRHADGKSRLIGVHPRRNEWDVIVTCRRKDHYAGSVADEVEAAKARARLNFPSEARRNKDRSRSSVVAFRQECKR